MPTLVLDIALSAEQFLAVYQGRANRVLVRSRDGRRVSVPAHHFRPFFTQEVLQVSFALEVNAAGDL